MRRAKEACGSAAAWLKARRVPVRRRSVQRRSLTTEAGLMAFRLSAGLGPVTMLVRPECCASKAAHLRIASQPAHVPTKPNAAAGRTNCTFPVHCSGQAVAATPCAPSPSPTTALRCEGDAVAVPASNIVAAAFLVRPSTLRGSRPATGSRYSIHHDWPLLFAPQSNARWCNAVFAVLRCCRGAIVEERVHGCGRAQVTGMTI
ncbi:hypothetical protein BST61_g9844 [Cercospora zeina]